MQSFRAWWWKEKQREGRSPRFERCAALAPSLSVEEITRALLCVHWLNPPPPPLSLPLSPSRTHTRLPLTHRHASYCVHIHATTLWMRFESMLKSTWSISQKHMRFTFESMWLKTPLKVWWGHRKLISCSLRDTESARIGIQQQLYNKMSSVHFSVNYSDWQGIFNWIDCMHKYKNSPRLIK